MKNNIPAVCTLLILLVFSSCMDRKNETSVTVSESGNIFRFTATFPENKTGKVEKIMKEKLSPNTIMTGGTKHIDATITLDDKTSFYLKSEPGDLTIEFDRYKNTKSSYGRIRNMCEEIKADLAK